MVELLVTITIISIIAGFALGGLFRAQEAARRDHTRGLVAKLHGQLMLRWESYETRRIPIVRDPGEQPGPFAARRLEALRELMRLEMPDRWTDVADLTDPMDISPITPAALASLPALSEAYWRNYERNVEPITGNLSMPTTDFQGAECLFMILSMGHDDALGTDRINSRDVGDVDQDGMKEFLDGWGRPIQFLRWAPGYLPPPLEEHKAETAAPADVDKHPGQNVVDTPWPRAVTDVQTGDPFHDPDPFDFRGIDVPIASSIDKQRGYRLFPLIYSAGPDGKYDIKGGGSGNTVYVSNNDPYFKLMENLGDPMNQYYKDLNYEVMIGTPMDIDVDGSFDHLDNITNHQLDINRAN